MFIYLSVANIIRIVFSYLILNSKLLKSKLDLLFLIVGIILSGVISFRQTIIGYAILFLILLLANLFFNMKNGKEPYIPIIKIILSFIICLFIQSISTPIERTLYSLNIDNFYFYFFSIEITKYILVGLISFFCLKYLIPIIKNNKFEKLILLLLFFSFFVLETVTILIYSNYQKMIIITFGVIFFLFSYITLITIINNSNLKNQLKIKEIEKEYLEKYYEDIQKQHKELRTFKHDYLNILSSLESFINKNKWNELKEYYYSSIKQTNEELRDLNLDSNGIDNIEIEEIKSIFIIKLMTVKKNNILTSFEVPDKILKYDNINYLVLVRILGIILDNSIEELEYIGKGKLEIGIFDIGKSYLFVIRNSIRQNIEPISTLYKKGFSTKGTRRGNGLPNLMKLISKEDAISLESEITQEFFIQKIYLSKGEV